MRPSPSKDEMPSCDEVEPLAAGLEGMVDLDRMVGQDHTAAPVRG
jgi:hypothetical protein